MQLDMHYYGTYVMARVAGIKAEAARIIAYAAQFVDDNANRDMIEFMDAGSINAEATAHHATNTKNLDPADQRQIWVPFHFLPGNEGSSFTERLICRKNSTIVDEMVDYNILEPNKEYALELIGITAHVYADTFAHYGFSGVSSRKNRIVNKSIKFHDLDPEIEKYITKKEKTFRKKYKKEGGLLRNIKSYIVEVVSGALGHGAVATYPDRPYLVWDFVYEKPKKKSGKRDNPATFLEGCEALHNMFRKFVKFYPEFAENNSYKEFRTIRSELKRILNTQADKKGRIKAWQKAVKSGVLHLSEEAIPKYKAEVWHKQRTAMDGKKHSTIALNRNAYRFYQAASVHRNYVLRTLLPKYRLIVA